MIQDIAPHKLNNQYDPLAVPEREDFVLCFDGGRLLKKVGKSTELLRVKDFPENCAFTYLFSLDNDRFFLLSVENTIPKGCAFSDVRILRGESSLPREILYAIFTGKHLSDWYRDTHFCGRCGKPMTHSTKERAMKCTCGYTAYPRIMPAVIVGVKNGDSILLTKYRTGFQHNALIAGFTEIGETAEETVAREVMEEAGVRVKNITYYKTQPWGIAGDLLIGYYCDLDGDPSITMDKGELRERSSRNKDGLPHHPAGWFAMTGEYSVGLADSQPLFARRNISILKKIPLTIEQEVGASSYWSEMAAMQTLDNLLMNKLITLKQYIERLPEGYISKKQELLAELSAASAQPQNMIPADTGTNMSVETTSENIPVQSGSGNGSLQRAINREGR